MTRPPNRITTSPRRIRSTANRPVPSIGDARGTAAGVSQQPGS
ncbi:hypothetical protein ACFMQL_35825 [Nonomuraea fastidiosa]|jgi:hypothetical protein